MANKIECVVTTGYAQGKHYCLDCAAAVGGERQEVESAETCPSCATMEAEATHEAAEHAAQREWMDQEADRFDAASL